MSPRVRTLLILGGALLAFAGATLLLSRYTVLAGFASLEESVTRQDALRARNALEAEVDLVDRVTTDWSAWDATYEYIRDHSPDYVASNITDDAFVSQGLSFILPLDSSASIVGGWAYDRQRDTAMPVPQGLLPHISAGAPLLRHATPRSLRRGVLLLPEAVALVSSHPIVTSEYTGPIRGTYVMGRLLGPRDLRRISAQACESVQLHRLDQALSPDVAGAAEALRSTGSAACALALGPDSVAGYTLVNDVYGVPALVVRIDKPRDLYRRGVQAVWYFVVWLLAISLLIVLVSLAMVGRAQAAMQASEQGLSTTLHGIAEAVIATNADGRIQRMNRVAEQLTGWSASEAAGAALDDVFRVVDPRAGKAAPAPGGSAERSAPHTVVYSRDSLLLRRDGSRRRIEASLAPIRDPAGRASGAVLVFRDVSQERKEQERERRAEKMQAIAQLAGGVAHDLNDQLAGILGFAELLMRRLGDNIEAARYVDNIIKACGRSADLTRRLLTFSRHRERRANVVDVNTTVASVIEQLQRGADRRVSVVRSLCGDAPVVLGDAAAVETALLNLARNSCEAMPEGGTLTFSTAVTRLEQGYQASTPLEVQAGPYVQVAVSDTGTGMDEQTQRHLFEPFFTTKEAGRGTGMGLAVVYGTVSNYGGTIDVRSAPGTGTTVTLYLPLHEQLAAAPVAPPLRVRSEPGVGRILVVDDEEVVRQMLAQALSSAGHTVVTRDNGAEALEFCRANAGGVDLVLLDMSMPRLGGRESFYALRALNPAMRILIISGHAPDEDVREVLDHGALGFIAKPVHVAELSRTVSDALRDPGAG